MRPLLYLLPALILLACSGSDDDATAGNAGSPSVASEVIDLDGADLGELVHWNDVYEASFWWPRADLWRLVTALGKSEDDRYHAFLLDLAFLPTPYKEASLELLLDRQGPFTADDIVGVVEERGFRGPENDLPQYLEFKQAIFATLIPEFGRFLDPEAPRTISAQEVFWGGVAVDGIPPLDEPGFVTPAAASEWILADDQVIGVELNGDVRAYPRRIIDWHEMVNDTIGGVPVSLAYCTLCGSAILYDGRHEGEVYRFGTSGLLYRSNKLMYDRNTRSLWEQYTGEPAWGSLVGSGIKLETLSVVHTTWESWFADHPDTKVLDIDTGFNRDYGPGVAYRDYWANSDLIFPAPDRDGPLARKDSVYAVRIEGVVAAYPIDLLASKGLIEDEIGGRPVVVIATTDGSGGRAYESGGLGFEISDLAAGTLVSDDGRGWRLTEAALVAEDGTELERLPGHNSFWFAVTNHASNWRLYGDD